MQHPFQQLRSEYESLLVSCVITRRDAVDQEALKLIAGMPRYSAVGQKLHIPATLIAVLHMRESSGNFGTFLGNGEPLSRVTRLVPKGRGPWFDPGAWEKGAEEALAIDHVADNSAPWSVAYAMWKEESFNGFGPRAHGCHSGYLWAGSNIYGGGKYVADGVWDASEDDKQIGCVPLMIRIAQIAPQFAITGMPDIDSHNVILPPMPVPEAVGGGRDATIKLQGMLNRLGAQILVDGSYGRRTREAVRDWQTVHHVRPFDGLAGPVTLKAMNAALAAMH